VKAMTGVAGEEAVPDFTRAGPAKKEVLGVVIIGAGGAIGRA
jgi:hypothetical protein